MEVIAGKQFRPPAAELPLKSKLRVSAASEAPTEVSADRKTIIKDGRRAGLGFEGLLIEALIHLISRLHGDEPRRLLDSDDGSTPRSIGPAEPVKIRGSMINFPHVCRVSGCWEIA